MKRKPGKFVSYVAPWTTPSGKRYTLHHCDPCGKTIQHRWEQQDSTHARLTCLGCEESFVKSLVREAT